MTVKQILKVFLKVKEFTRESPCTKVHIHNAFMVGSAYAPVPVVDYMAVAGANSRKYLKREGYAVERLSGGIDIIELTAEGRDWLTKGLASHLARHPEDAVDVVKPTAKKGVQFVARVRRR